MKKLNYKRIIGLFIFALTIMLFGITTVNAASAKCQNILNDLNAEDVQKTRYGLEIDYDKNGDGGNGAYVVKAAVPTATINVFTGIDPSFKKNTIKFKIGGIYFYEPNEDKNVERSTIKNYIDSGTNNGGIQDISGQVSALKNAGVISNNTLSRNGSFTIKRTIFNYNSEPKRREGIAVKLVPDGFNDPELVSACGNNAKFYMVVYTSVEAGAELPPEGEISFEGDGASFTYGQIDCSNYESKWKGKNEFNYNFCKDKAEAEANPTKTKNYVIEDYKKDKNSKTSMIKYEKDILGNKTKVTDPIAFKCNYKDTISGVLEGDNYYVNKNYIHGVGEITVSQGQYVYTGEYDGNKKHKQGEDKEGMLSTNKKAATCKLSCEEIVKAEYGPPVAAAGGICFEYKVKVTSRVNCAIKDITPPPTHVICTPTPWCNHPGGYPDHQGGPNEDFDACVTSCDGGVYSDKCVSKCYKDIYGGSVVRQTTGTEIEYGTEGKTVDRSSLKYQYLFKFGELVWYVGGNGGVTSRVKVDTNGNKTGNVTGKGGPKQHSHATRDVLTDSYWHKHNDWGYPTSVYVEYDKTGIPRIDNCSTKNCWWDLNKSKACTNSNNYRYLNHPDVYSKRVGTKYPGISAYEQDLKKNQEIYEQLKETCSRYASCNTTTAEFTISIKFTETGKDTETTIDFPYETKKDTITSQENLASCPDKDKSIILSSDGCYNCDSISGDKKKMYMTEWSFPGTWFDTKFGTITYNPSTINNTEWRSVPYKFCLPRAVETVNAKWYNYYQAKVNGDNKDYSINNTEYLQSISCPDGTKLTSVCDYRSTTYDDADAKAVSSPTDTSGTYYNINASTRDFGMYEWDIDIACFYAVNNEFPCAGKGSENEGKLQCPGTDKNTKMRIRSVDLNNLFPDKEGNELTNPNTTGRTPGFNWTSYASQTKKDPDYVSVPSDYTAWIQTKGTGVYSEEYLDYEVTLTKEDITKIREDVNKKFNKKYTTWEGDTEVNSVVNYQSDLIRKELTNSKYPKGDAITCNNMKNYKSTECEDEFIKEGK